MTQPPRILISGAGIAGTIVAYWLGRAGIRSLVVERAPSLRTAGQQLDIKGVARGIIRSMGIEAAIRKESTKEEGMHFVDENDRIFGSFAVDPEHGFSGVCDIEITRHRLVKIIYDASLDMADYIFGDAIAGMEDGEKGALVFFESGKQQSFQAVVIADGQGSAARNTVFKRGEDFDYKPVGYYGAFFSIPYESRDGTWSRWYTSDKRRWTWLRPEPDTKTTRAFFNTGGEMADAHFKGYRKMDAAAQKELWKEVFQGVGWQTDRIIEGMLDADDFYMTQFAQIKAEKWSKGRVVLVGDAGYCPTPMSGMGTSTAIVGAYILAGEIASRTLGSGDLERSYLEYERKFRPYVLEVQDRLPLSIFRLATPETWYGLYAMRWAVWAASWFASTRLAKTLFGGTNEEDDGPKIVLDKYEWTS